MFQETAAAFEAAVSAGLRIDAEAARLRLHVLARALFMTDAELRDAVGYSAMLQARRGTVEALITDVRIQAYRDVLAGTEDYA